MRRCRARAMRRRRRSVICRTIGADLVGMSTALETIAANHMGMKVLGISCVTNFAAGVTDQKLDHKEVLEVGERVERHDGRTAAARAASACSEVRLWTR